MLTRDDIVKMPEQAKVEKDTGGRKILEGLKATAEAEKADWMAKLNETEKAIAQASQLRSELIGRANQAVGAIAALDKAIAELDAAERKD